MRPSNGGVQSIGNAISCNFLCFSHKILLRPGKGWNTYCVPSASQIRDVVVVSGDRGRRGEDVQGGPCESRDNSPRKAGRFTSPWTSARHPAKSATRTARWCSGWTKWRFRPPGPRSPATCWPRNISARPGSRPSSSASRKWTCPPGCGGGGRTAMPPAAAPPPGRPAPSRSSTGWPGPGLIGGGRPAISIPKATPGPITMKSDTCLPHRWPRPTRPSGSTQGFTGPTASTGRPRAIPTWITGPASWSIRTRPTNIPSPMRALSRASRTTWSTTAASWTCGCARPGCSSTARARAPISPACAPKARTFPGAANPPA